MKTLTPRKLLTGISLKVLLQTLQKSIDLDTKYLRLLNTIPFFNEVILTSELS